LFFLFPEFLPFFFFRLASRGPSFFPGAGGGTFRGNKKFLFSTNFLLMSFPAPVRAFFPSQFLGPLFRVFCLVLLTPFFLVDSKDALFFPSANNGPFSLGRPLAFSPLHLFLLSFFHLPRSFPRQIFFFGHLLSGALLADTSPSDFRQVDLFEFSSPSQFHCLDEMNFLAL